MTWTVPMTPVDGRKMQNKLLIINPMMVTDEARVNDYLKDGWLVKDVKFHDGASLLVAVILEREVERED